MPTWAPAGTVTSRSAIASPLTLPGVTSVTVCALASPFFTMSSTPRPVVQVSPPAPAAVKVMVPPDSGIAVLVSAAISVVSLDESAAGHRHEQHDLRPVLGLVLDQAHGAGAGLQLGEAERRVGLQPLRHAR